MDWQWIEDTFAALPGSNDLLFQKLWSEKRLRFRGPRDATDAIDEYNARLVCAALSRDRSVFLGLPDSRVHRPALLLAIGLIRQWHDTRRDNAYAGPVLYFGNAVGIREDLHHTTIRGMDIDLADVFRQENIARIKGGNYNRIASKLPHVITIYAPSDPATMIARYRPRWIAIDCGDSPSASWLSPLLESARSHQITTIAWGRNPIAQTVSQFEKNGDVFLWPLKAPVTSCLETIIEHSPVFELQPIVITGGKVTL